MKVLAFTILFALIGITSAQADCRDQSTHRAMNECANHEFKVSDRRMNSVYRRAMSAQSRSHKQALRKAQRSWIKFRDNACSSYSLLSEGGKIRPLLFSHCLSKLTVARTKMLQMQTIGSAE